MAYLPTADKLASMGASRIAGNLWSLLTAQNRYTLRVGSRSIGLRPAQLLGEDSPATDRLVFASEAEFDAYLATLD